MRQQSKFGFFFIIRCESDKSKHVNGKRPKMTLRSDGLRNVCIIMSSFVGDKLIFPLSEINFYELENKKKVEGF